MWTTPPTDRARRRALVLLALGSTLGVLLGIASARRDQRTLPSDTLPNDAIALVNGKLIREDEFANAVALLAGDKRDAISEVDRAHVLQRLIEEELLVQQGIARGFVASERSVRQAIATAMLDAIVAESASEQSADAALRDYLDWLRNEAKITVAPEHGR